MIIGFLLIQLISLIGTAQEATELTAPPPASVPVVQSSPAQPTESAPPTSAGNQGTPGNAAVNSGESTSGDSNDCPFISTSTMSASNLRELANSAAAKANGCSTYLTAAANKYDQLLRLDNPNGNSGKPNANPNPSNGQQASNLPLANQNGQQNSGQPSNASSDGDAMAILKQMATDFVESMRSVPDNCWQDNLEAVVQEAGAGIAQNLVQKYGGDIGEILAPLVAFLGDKFFNDVPIASRNADALIGFYEGQSAACYYWEQFFKLGYCNQASANNGTPSADDACLNPPVFDMTTIGSLANDVADTNYFEERDGFTTWFVGTERENIREYVGGVARYLNKLNGETDEIKNEYIRKAFKACIGLLGVYYFQNAMTEKNQTPFDKIDLAFMKDYPTECTKWFNGCLPNITDAQTLKTFMCDNRDLIKLWNTTTSGKCSGDSLNTCTICGNSIGTLLSAGSTPSQTSAGSAATPTSPPATPTKPAKVEIGGVD